MTEQHSTSAASGLPGQQVYVTNDEDAPGVHHLGYRSWAGERTLGWTRWMVISNVGVRRAWVSFWVRRLLFFASLPAIWFGVLFFLWEQATLYSEWRGFLIPMLNGLPPTPDFEGIREAVLTGNMESSRHTVWASLLLTFFRYPQAVLMVLMIGLIAPPMISQDIRSRAFLLYFSRPLTRGEYVLGKLATIWAYLAMISAMPALVLYVLGVVFSPNLSVVLSTWDLPLRIILATIVLMLPTSMLALAMSSLTQESRYAGFAWFAVWILGWFTYGAASTAEAFNAQQAYFEQQRNMNPHSVIVMHESSWTYISLYHTLGRVQRWVFGFGEFSEAAVPLLIVTAVTLGSWAILYRRISAPMRI